MKAKKDTIDVEFIWERTRVTLEFMLDHVVLAYGEKSKSKHKGLAFPSPEYMIDLASKMLLVAEERKRFQESQRGGKNAELEVEE